MPLTNVPAAFVSDFGPMPAVEDDDYTAALGLLGRELPRPRAVVVMSGHWETEGPLGLTSSAEPEQIYDFTGFPEEYYRVQWRPPGAPAVASKAAALLEAAGVKAFEDPLRGIDHGAWVPLSRVFPDAGVPVVQLSVPAGKAPAWVLKIGQALSPLRRDGVLLVGAGALVHNLRRVRFGASDVDPWAREFAGWLEPRLAQGRVDELADYARLAPSAGLAVPTHEHFDPLFFTLGAGAGGTLRDYYRGFAHGSGLLRAFTLG